MKKLKNRKIWVVGRILVLVILNALFFVQVHPVVAMFGNQHIADVLFHVWFDVLPTSTAGRYYRALALKHLSEFNKILDDHPEHFNETTNVILMFFPVLEALPDDKGDEARITEEQISALELEWMWFSSLASPSFQTDMENELQRFPLESFIGMTMYEALDFLDSNWPAELTAELILPPTATPSPFPTAYATMTSFPTSVCILGSGPDCLTEPSLVPNSNGAWVYDIVDGVYFEYPSDWRVEQSAVYLDLSFIASADSHEGLNASGIYLHIENVILPEDVRYDELGCTSTGIQVGSPPKWHQMISLFDFKGSEYLWDNSGNAEYLQVNLYNENHQRMVCLSIVIDNEQTDQMTDTAEIAKEKFEDFHHIVESFRIWNE